MSQKKRFMEDQCECTGSYCVDYPRGNWPTVLATLLFLVCWIGGVVLAKGFWLTNAAIWFFPYAWYLVIEKVMLAFNLI